MFLTKETRYEIVRAENPFVGKDGGVSALNCLGRSANRPHKTTAIEVGDVLSSLIPAFIKVL